MNNTIRAYAKINLSLDIVSKRDDGYHDLKTVMHTVDLYDELTFKENGSDSGKIITESKKIPRGTDNIIIKTLDEFYRLTGLTPVGFDIELKKRIPVCAGLGGGSSDAAAALKFINGYTGFPLSDDELYSVAAKLGADIPFCLTGGTCLCEGIGEIITPLPPLPECFIVIAKPSSKGLSTKSIFSKVNVGKIAYHPDTNGIIRALEANDIANVCKRVYNVLEEYSIPDCAEIGMIKKTLSDSGAAAAAMSGSGSAVFGIFYDKNDAENAFCELKKTTDDIFIV